MIAAVRKLHSSRGFSRASTILLILVVVMLIVVMVLPTWSDYRERGDRVDCAEALSAATRQMMYLYAGGGDPDPETIKETVERSMRSWDDLCIAGGTVYLAPDNNEVVPYRIVCGLHDSDARERTRLNAAYVLDGVRDELRLEKLLGSAAPDSVAVTVNGTELTCVRVEQELPIDTGTNFYKDYSGTVAYYALAGYGGADAGEADTGDICYFLYADGEHCAVWRAPDIWSGDSYRY